MKQIPFAIKRTFYSLFVLLLLVFFDVSVANNVFPSSDDSLNIPALVTHEQEAELLFNPQLRSFSLKGSETSYFISIYDNWGRLLWRNEGVYVNKDYPVPTINDGIYVVHIKNKRTKKITAQMLMVDF